MAAGGAAAEGDLAAAGPQPRRGSARAAGRSLPLEAGRLVGPAEREALGSAPVRLRWLVNAPAVPFGSTSRL